MELSMVYTDWHLLKTTQIISDKGQICCCCSVTQPNSLQPHGLQHARLPCPSASPRACSNSCPLSQARFEAMLITIFAILLSACSVMSDSLQSCQAPLSMEFPRQEYWRGLPFPSVGDLPDRGIEPVSVCVLCLCALAGRFFTNAPPGRLHCWPTKDTLKHVNFIQIITLRFRAVAAHLSPFSPSHLLLEISDLHKDQSHDWKRQRKMRAEGAQGDDSVGGLHFKKGN